MVNIKGNRMKTDLVNFAPLARLLLHEAGVDARHDLVKVLEIERPNHLVNIFPPLSRKYR